MTVWSGVPNNVKAGGGAAVAEAFNWGYYYSNFPSTPAVSGIGTSVATGTTPNTQNNFGTLLTALATDIHYVKILMSGVFHTGTAVAALASIVYDPAGGTSWQSLIDNFPVGYASQLYLGALIELPLWVPAGSSIGATVQCEYSTSLYCSFLIEARGEPSNPAMWKSGTAVETLGANTGTSKGVSVVAGDSSAWGSWATIGTPTHDYCAVNLGLQPDGSSLVTNYYDFDMGTESARIPGSTTDVRRTSTTPNADRYLSSGGNIYVPSGTDIQVRGKCSGTHEAWNAVVLGCY